MTFAISPGVYTVELDKSTTVPAVGSSVGGFVGSFRWGPVEQPVLAGSEDDVVNIFGTPRKTDSDFFFAAQFLAYTNAMRVIRVTGSGAANAHSGTGSGTVLVKNDADYQDGFVVPSALSSVEFIASFPGTFGNGVSVVIAPNAAVFNSVSFAPYRSFFTKAPGTSDYAADRGKTFDEMHVAVVDTTGAISGIAGTVIETYAFVSQASDAKLPQGASNYYADIINRSSRYVRFANHASELDKAGISTTALVGNTYAPTIPVTAVLQYTLSGGLDGAGLVDADYIRGYDLFADPESSEISLLPVGNVSDVVKAYVVQNIAEVRKDCFVTISPKYESVVANVGDELDATIADRNSLNINSSYVSMDSNWKYIYDKYNDRNLWVPCAADVAGLCARTDANAAPWFSPAGINRGVLKNVIKLAWNPKEAQRDDLYSNEINPIVNKIGTGVILFGDKTLLTRESAFSRINVRRLFIVLEKSIGIAAQTFLFEQNTPITRSLFVSTVEPVLREVQGRQGISAFLVVADEKINTPNRIDRNEFHAEIYVQATRSVNFIKLTYVATRTGVSFDELVGTN